VRAVRILAFVGCMLTWAHHGFSQQSIDYASVRGRVVDPSGAAVPGASVTVRHTATDVTASTVTDREGRFRFPSLRPGPYEITVHMQGFADATRLLTLTIGAAFDLPIPLSLASLDTVLTVAADATVLEAARTQNAATISETEVQALPLNGRNLLDAALLVPGVSPTNIANAQMFPETSAVPGTGLSVSSQRNLSNNFVVDGLSSNDDAAALSGITYGVDAVEQLQVVTSGGQAALGRALGGYVNIVTKSGTNTLHGTAYDYARDDRLNTPNGLSGTTLPMNQWQFGGSLGGPIVRNRSFFFSNVEQRVLDQSGLVTISPASVEAINGRLMATGYQGSQIATGVYPIPIDSTNVLAKLDHQVSNRDQVVVRYGLYKLDSRNSRNGGGLVGTTATTHLENVDQTVGIGNTLSLSASTVLESRAQFAYGDLKAPPFDPVGPAVSIAGVASFGTSSGNPARRTNWMYQVVNNLSHQAGAHAIRVGVDLLYNDDRIVYPRAARGSYSFSSLANFLSGAYNNAGFSQTFAVSEIEQTNPNVGIYAQDEWKMTPRVTLNAGLRYDLQFLQTITTDTDNFSPRAGVAWSPFESQRTIVRASAGLFYDRVPLRAVANALLSAGNTTDVSNLRQIAVNLSPGQVGAPVFPSILQTVVPSVTLPALTTMDRRLQNANSRQASVEVEQQIGERTTVSAAYQYLRGLRLIMAINQNVPSCIASGTNNGCRPNPNYGNNSQYSAAGDSTYHGLHLSFIQRPARWGHYRISYTLSKAMNNVGEAFFSAPIDPFDLAKDWGRSDNDQRHRLVVNGSLQTSSAPATSVWELISHGFQVSGMVQAYSALPFNITSGVTTIQGTAGRPVVNGAFIPRNAGTGSDFFTLNARVSRSFRLTGRLELEALGEGFNLTDRVNALGRNTNFGSGSYPDNPLATFGQITAVGESRSFQLGVRLRF
jgi:hypothetical protein